MATQVREATRSDVASIRRLAKALNVFHKDPTHLFTAAVVRRDGFGPSRAFAVLVAEQRGAVVGYALFLDAYEPVYAARGLYLCDVYVVPRARRSGVGRALIAAVAAHARRRRRTFVWWVARAWNKPAQRFYRTLGAVEEKVVAHAVTFDAFEALAKEGRGVLPRPKRRARRRR
jgi:ribosomal protein S18 acetylase RimI-like enzyme